MHYKNNTRYKTSWERREKERVKNLKNFREDIRVGVNVARE